MSLKTSQIILAVVDFVCGAVFGACAMRMIDNDSSKKDKKDFCTEEA